MGATVLIAIYQLRFDVWSFTPEPGVAPMHVEVPEGSELKATHGLHVQLLFVPNPDDPFVTRGLWANEIVREAMGGESERFAIVDNPTRRAAS